MTRPQVYLAAEDRLGLALGRRLIREQNQLSIFREYNGQGFGNLRTEIDKYQAMARNGFPVVLMTDLDKAPCPVALIEGWMGAGKRPAGALLLRICVRAAEAWVLADSKTVAEFLGIDPDRVASQPEGLQDPKVELLRLAEGANRTLRKRFLPLPGSKATVGHDYNRLLEEFVATLWNPTAAALRSPSLARARLRLKELSRLVGG